jgi:uncharacterized C2H2 Zn-finger protein
MMIQLGAWHTEWAQKWGIDDYPYDGDTIEEWEGRIPPEAEADYRRRANEIMGVDPLTGLRPQSPPAGSHRAEPGAARPAPARPAIPVARTRDEAIFYMTLHRCPRCGSQQTPWSASLVEVDGVMARRYSGDCGNCGQSREFTFGLPDRIAARPPGVEMHYGGDEPSELIDPGQWLLMYEPAAEQARADLAAGDPASARVPAELALACVDEVIKFIPSGETAVPESAFWSPAGRTAYAADASRFTLRRLVLLLDMLHDEFDAPLGRPAPAGPETPAPTGPAAPATGDEGTGDEGTGDEGTGDEGTADESTAALPLGRTNAEIHLYLDRQPCQCGAASTRWTSQLRQRDGELVAWYRSDCPRCGRERGLGFRLPAENIPSGPEGAHFRYGAEQPSELIDPGEWLAVADELSRSVPMLPADATEQERGRFRYAMGRAAAALSEVAKFAPPGAVEVPGSAFFTDRGRAVHRTAPGRFRLDRLAAVRSTYLQLLADAGLE